MRRIVTAVVCLLCVTSAAVVPQAAPRLPGAADDERTIVCESKNYRYRYCRVDTENRATLVRQISAVSRCEYGDSWGYDSRGVWVDRGCQGEFRVGRGSSATNAAVAAVAVGAVIAAAIASSKSHHSDPVDSWAVGTFRGYDEVEATDVELTVLPGGSVTGLAGESQFSGRWERSMLQAGKHRFKVERSGNGFLAVDENDADHRIQFRRVGSGY